VTENGCWANSRQAQEDSEDAGCEAKFIIRPTPGLRSWPVKDFSAIRVYYLTSEKMLRIVRVLHGQRDINPMLEDEPMHSE